MFNYSKDNDNIVTITMDMQGRSANVINEEFGKLWLETLNRLEAEKADIAGVVLTSAKSTFFAGADIDNLYKQTNPQEIFDMCEGLKKQLRRLETLGKPVVAALFPGPTGASDSGRSCDDRCGHGRCAYGAGARSGRLYRGPEVQP